MATPISSKILAEIRAFVVVKHPGATGEQIMLVLAKLNTCYHLNLILGSCLGTKNSMLAGEVKDKSSSEEERVFRTSRGERFGAKNSKSAVQVTSSEEEGVFWTSRGERFETKDSMLAVQVKDESSFKEEEVFGTSRGERFETENSKLAVLVKDDSSSEEEGVFCTSRGERLVRENNYYQRGCDHDDGEKKGEDFHLTDLVEDIIDFALAAQHDTELSQFTRDVSYCAAFDTCKVAMEKARVKMDLEKDMCENFGKEVEWMTTSSGHYRSPPLSEAFKEEVDNARVQAIYLVSL